MTLFPDHDGESESYMSSARDQASVDADVRRRVYDGFMTTGKAPLSGELAAATGISAGDLKASFDRLAAGHILVLQAGSQEILMANPFSAVPTTFVVRAGGVSYWGNCIWDALGIAAMLKQDATIQTACGDCNEAMNLTIKDGAPGQAEGIIHFSIPARQWWSNITFT